MHLYMSGTLQSSSLVLLQWSLLRRHHIEDTLRFSLSLKGSNSIRKFLTTLLSRKGKDAMPMIGSNSPIKYA